MCMLTAPFFNVPNSSPNLSPVADVTAAKCSRLHLSQCRQREEHYLPPQHLSTSGVEPGSGSGRAHTTWERLLPLPWLWGRKLSGRAAVQGTTGECPAPGRKTLSRPLQKISLKSHSSTGLNETDCRKHKVGKVIGLGST